MSPKQRAARAFLARAAENPYRVVERENRRYVQVFPGDAGASRATWRAALRGIEGVVAEFQVVAYYLPRGSKQHFGTDGKWLVPVEALKH